MPFGHDGVVAVAERGAGACEVRLLERLLERARVVPERLAHGLGRAPQPGRALGVPGVGRQPCETVEADVERAPVACLPGLRQTLGEQFPAAICVALE